MNGARPGAPMTTTASRPSEVMRAATVPSASSAMVDCPSAQSGPWNSASTVVRATALLPSDSPEWT